jgi:hypothetical protein
MLFLGTPAGYYIGLFATAFTLMIFFGLLIPTILYYYRIGRIRRNSVMGGISILIIIIIISGSLAFALIPSALRDGAAATVILIIVELIFFLIITAGISYSIRSKKKIMGDKFVEIKKRETVIPKESDWKSVAGRVGPVLILIEGIVFLIEFVLNFIWGGFFYQFVPYLVLISGIIAVSSIYLGFKRIEYARFICCIAGILALVSFILVWPYTYRAFTLLSFVQFLFIDYILIILFFIGGLLCAISGDRFLNYYLDRSDLKKELVNIEVEMDKIEDLGQFLKEKLSTDWGKIKRSFDAYNSGEITKAVFIEIAIKNIGKEKFVSCFTASTTQD